ncbi:uncharacterized protein METZ01_LOCUS493372, partial [marine metagenome]
MTKSYELLIGKGKKKSADSIPVINPYTNGSFANVYLAGKAEINEAIILACEAFKKT